MCFCNDVIDPKVKIKRLAETNKYRKNQMRVLQNDILRDEYKIAVLKRGKR